MSPNALLGAVVGALIGAAAWAAIAYFTGYELGYVAWGVGGLVGGLAAKLGSKGSAAGMTCAGLALAAILLGKLGAAHFLIEREQEKIEASVEKFAAISFTPELHAERSADAGVFREVKSKAGYPQFMFDRGYTQAESVEAVTPEEVAEFIRVGIPEMQPFLDGSPDYQTWARDGRQEFVAQFTLDVTAMDVVKEGLGLFDVLFALLGIGTAFKLGEGLGATPSGGGGRRPRRTGGRPIAPRPGSSEPRTPRPPTPGQRAPGTPPPVPGKVGQAPVRRRRKR